MSFCDAPYNVDYANAAKNKSLAKDRRILNDAAEQHSFCKIQQAA